MPEDKDQYRAEALHKHKNDEDWRGFYLPQDLSNTVLFTRTQLLQLIERKKQLDEEIKTLNREQIEAKEQEKQMRKQINENRKARNDKEREYNER